MKMSSRYGDRIGLCYLVYLAIAKILDTTTYLS